MNSTECKLYNEEYQVTLHIQSEKRDASFGVIKKRINENFKINNPRHITPRDIQWFHPLRAIVLRFTPLLDKTLKR